MANIVTRLLIDDKQFDSRLSKASNSVKSFDARIGNLGSKTGASVLNFFTKLGGVVGLGMGAFEAFEKTINSTTVTADFFEIKMSQAKASTDLFFSSLAQGDFSNFFSNMTRAINLAGNFKESMQELDAVQFFGGLDFARAEAEYNEYIGNLNDRLLSTEERAKNEKLAREKLEEMKRISSSEQAHLLDTTLNQFRSLIASKGYQGAENLTEDDIMYLLSNYGRTFREELGSEFGKRKENINYARKYIAKGARAADFAKNIREDYQFSRDNPLAEMSYYAMLIDEGSEQMQNIKSSLERYYGLKKQIDNYTTTIDNSTKKLEKTIASESKKNEIKKYSEEWYEKNRPEVIRVSQELEVDLKPYVDENSLKNWADTLQYEKIITKSVGRKKIGFDPASTKVDTSRIHDPLAGWVDNMRERVSANEIFSESVGGMAQSLSVFAGVMNDNAGSWSSYTANVLTNIAQLIPQIAALTGKQWGLALAQSATTGVLGWINLGVMTAAMIASMAAIPKLASGGVAFGNSLVNVGEYPNAGTNPEVIAPLNKLREYITPPNDNAGKVTFKISGRDLYGILEKETNFKKRTK